MKLTMPLLALVVAILLVASQSIYTVDQRKYAIKFQLGEIIETQSTAGLYFKVPLVQNVRFYDQRNLTLDNPSPTASTTSEKKPLLVDFVVLWRIIDVKQYYVSVAGRRGSGAAPAVADGAREPRRGVQQAHRARGDLDRARQDHDDDAAEGRRRTRDRSASRSSTCGCAALELPPDVTGPVYQRMESERRRVANELRSLGRAPSRRRSAPTPTASAQVILADAYRAAQKIKGEGDAKASAIYAHAYGQNPEFYAFYRSLEAYKATFRNRAT